MATTPSNPTRLQTPPATSYPGHSFAVHSFAGEGLRVPAQTALRAVPSRQPSPRAAYMVALQKEPEDACLTGGTRSLDRRLLALNLYGSAIKAKLLGPRPVEKLLSPTPAALTRSPAASAA
jgi:hypothetical protein